MLAALLFLLAFGGVLLVVTACALHRQVRTARRAMAPVAGSRGPEFMEGEKAPRVSAPSLGGNILTIGGATRDPRFMLLLFVEPGSKLCESVVGDAVDLCRRRSVRLLLVGEGDSGGYDSLVLQKRIDHDDLILSNSLREDFLIGPVPSAALLNPDGYLVARGTVQHRDHLDALLTALCSQAEDDGVVRMERKAG
ncbi:MAG TPA: hypothetical protein VNR60_02815 [Croceibacterium sp.]|nr:hypothetical protein [Croceibacterium sp.]